jgi:hypothetical protein
MKEKSRQSTEETPIPVRRLTTEEIREIARKRHANPPAVIHPKNVEPHPKLPPPLGAVRESIRLEQESSK